MRTRSSTPFFLLTLVFAGCDRSTEPNGPGYLEIREVTVGPTLAKCYGVGLQSCMVVDGEFFYGRIGGFEYEAGYDYRLRIGKYDPWGGQEPPQDAGRYAYRLLEQLEKTPAPSTPATSSVVSKVWPARARRFLNSAPSTPLLPTRIPETPSPCSL
jgi:hypothetical protein